MLGRTAVVGGPLVACLLLGACGGGSAVTRGGAPYALSPGPSATPPAEGPTATATSTSPSQILTPPANSLGKRIPIAPERAPSSFEASDSEFLAQAQVTLQQFEVEAPGPKDRMVAVGREFCSILSGGGRVAEKVDFWGGLTRLAGKGWTAVFVAAMATYCPELSEGYIQARSNAPPVLPAERADLARYVVRRSLGSQLTGTGRFDAVSDAELASRAGETCHDLQAQSDAGTLDLPREPSALATDLALVDAYCPAEFDLLEAALTPLANS